VRRSSQHGVADHLPPERDFFIDNLLVRIHLIIVMIRWTGLAPWEFAFPFPGSLTSTFLTPHQFENNYFTEMRCGSEEGSYFRLIDFVFHSTLGLRVTKKNPTNPQNYLNERPHRIKSRSHAVAE